MKHALLRPSLTTLAASLGLAGLAQAHSGHSVLDPVAGLPHAGHESELATLLIATALTVAIFAGARWLVERRR